MAQTIKTIGSSGQLSLGKEYAGCTVVVEVSEPGVWQIKTVKVIPDNELWLTEEPVKTQIDEAIRWAEANPPVETNLDALTDAVRERGG